MAIEDDTTYGLTGAQLTDLAEKVKSAGYKTLTEDDYDVPEDNPTAVALWKLDEGIYHTQPGVKLARSVRNGVAYDPYNSHFSRTGSAWVFITKNESYYTATGTVKADGIGYSIIASFPVTGRYYQTWYARGCIHLDSGSQSVSGGSLMPLESSESLTVFSNDYLATASAVNLLNVNKLETSNLLADGGLTATITGTGANRQVTISGSALSTAISDLATATESDLATKQDAYYSDGEVIDFTGGIYPITVEENSDDPMTSMVTFTERLQKKLPTGATLTVTVSQPADATFYLMDDGGTKITTTIHSGTVEGMGGIARISLVTEPLDYGQGGVVDFYGVSGLTLTVNVPAS